MNLKNKIVAFILCLFLVATGSFFVFGSAPKAQAATTNGAALSIAQLQQIVNSLLQQIQQIMQLLAQREQTQPVGTCGNLICDFGETTTCPQDCTDNSQNCADICKAQGYTNSQCNTYAISPQGFANQCAAGYVKSSVSASDCAVTPGIVGIGKSCCCGSGTATCASEGQTLYPAQKCCWGLTAVALSGCTSTGCVNNSICKKLQNCGNDVCDQGEDNLNCPQDCQLSTTPAFILASVATSSTAATAAGKASISATFNVQR